MIKNCSTCAEWKLYMRIDNMCACMGRSSGCNPGGQLYTSPISNCKNWSKRPSYEKFRKSIKIKRSIDDKKL